MFHVKHSSPGAYRLKRYGIQDTPNAMDPEDKGIAPITYIAGRIDEMPFSVQLELPASRTEMHSRHMIGSAIWAHDQTESVTVLNF